MYVAEVGAWLLCRQGFYFWYFLPKHLLESTPTVIRYTIQSHLQPTTIFRQKYILFMSINIVIMCYYCYSLPLIFVLSTTGHLSVVFLLWLIFLPPYQETICLSVLRIKMRERLVYSYSSQLHNVVNISGTCTQRESYLSLVTYPSSSSQVLGGNSRTSTPVRV